MKRKLVSARTRRQYQQKEERKNDKYEYEDSYDDDHIRDYYSKNMIICFLKM